MLLDGHTTCVGWPFLFSSQLALVKDETRPSAPTARSLVHLPRCGTPARRDPATLALALFVRSLAIACDRD